MIEHEELEEDLEEVFDWPLYFHHYHDDDDLADMFIEIEGPSGPAWYVNRSSPERLPLLMYDVVIEAARGYFDEVDKDETPFADIDNE